MIKQLNTKLSLLCLSACLFGTAQANDNVGLSFAQVPQISDMACFNTDPELKPNTREVTFVVRNNGNETMQLGNVNIQNHDQFADSLTTVLYDKADDCKTALAAGQTCNIRVEITPPQCPAHPTEGYLMPIEGEALTRTLQVGSIDAPINGNLTTLGAAAFFLLLSADGGIHNNEGTSQVDGIIGTTKRKHGITGAIDSDGERIHDMSTFMGELDLAHAYKTLRRMPCDELSGNLGTEFDYRDEHATYVTPGVYCPVGDRGIGADEELATTYGPFNTSVDVRGTFTLDGNNSRENDIFVFLLCDQDLIAGKDNRWSSVGTAEEYKTEVKLINNARANRVFWLLDSGSARINANTKFVGNIILLDDQRFAPVDASGMPIFGSATLSLLTDNEHSSAALRGRGYIVEQPFNFFPATIELSGNSVTDPLKPVKP